MVQIKQMIVSKSIQNRLTYGGKNPVKYIMIHQTANTSKGANAYMHAKLQANGNSRQASWHYQVDADNIYQSFPDTAQAWHAGNRYYNQNSIGIELTVNSDGNYIGTVEHGAELVKYLMNKHNVPISNVIRHKDASGKYCPRELLDGKNGITWAKFKQMVQGASTPKPAPSKPSKPATPSKPTTSKPANKTIEQLADEVIAGKHGTGEARKKSLGSNYQAVQNLVNKKLGAKPKPSKSIEQLAKEVIDGKHGTGEARKKALGSNYKAVQDLVNKKLGAKSTSNSKPKGKSWQTVAREIYQGKGGWGNDPERTRKLKNAGYNAKQVQAEVNRLIRENGRSNRKVTKGSRVTISNTAKKYTTGETIPNWVKGNTYTVMEVGSGKVLLREIMSWVYTTDLVNY